MPRLGIKLTAELHLLERPFKDALPSEPHGRGLGYGVKFRLVVSFQELPTWVYSDMEHV